MSEHGLFPGDSLINQLESKCHALEQGVSDPTLLCSCVASQGLILVEIARNGVITPKICENKHKGLGMQNWKSVFTFIVALLTISATVITVVHLLVAK